MNLTSRLVCFFFSALLLSSSLSAAEFEYPDTTDHGSHFAILSHLGAGFGGTYSGAGINLNFEFSYIGVDLGIGAMGPGAGLRVYLSAPSETFRYRLGLFAAHSYRLTPQPGDDASYFIYPSIGFDYRFSQSRFGLGFDLGIMGLAYESASPGGNSGALTPMLSLGFMVNLGSAKKYGLPAAD